MKTEEYETEHLTRLKLINDNELNSVSLKKNYRRSLERSICTKISSDLITPSQPPYNNKNTIVKPLNNTTLLTNKGQTKTRHKAIQIRHSALVGVWAPLSRYWCLAPLPKLKLSLPRMCATACKVLIQDHSRASTQEVVKIWKIKKTKYF